ncbi:MAG TPA: class I SAM-dependent methyltransferase [Nocardioides sp.]|nr:class I SAM-dependent methyltransferase [Nocardioides sp.]
MRNFGPVWGPAKVQWYADGRRGDEAETVDLLHDLVTDGDALALAVGSGRVALPLAARGVTVDGIELSPAMTEPLRERTGGRRYRLVYLLSTTLFDLLTQDEQVRCFENAARHLEATGMFLVEAAVPNAWSHNGKTGTAGAVHGELVRYDASRHDPATELLEENHVAVSGAGSPSDSSAQRPAWPAELDLLARIAGLRLRHRWGGWHREPFGAESVRHVSIYERVDTN